MGRIERPINLISERFDDTDSPVLQAVTFLTKPWGYFAGRQVIKFNLDHTYTTQPEFPENYKMSAWKTAAFVLLAIPSWFFTLALALGTYFLHPYSKKLFLKRLHSVLQVATIKEKPSPNESKEHKEYNILSENAISHRSASYLDHSSLNALTHVSRKFYHQHNPKLKAICLRYLDAQFLPSVTAFEGAPSLEINKRRIYLRTSREPFYQYISPFRPREPMERIKWHLLSAFSFDMLMRGDICGYFSPRSGEGYADLFHNRRMNAATIISKLSSKYQLQINEIFRERNLKILIKHSTTHESLYFLLGVFHGDFCPNPDLVIQKIGKKLNSPLVIHFGRPTAGLYAPHTDLIICVRYVVLERGNEVKEGVFRINCIIKRGQALFFDPDYVLTLDGEQEVKDVITDWPIETNPVLKRFLRGEEIPLPQQAGRQPQSLRIAQL